MPFYDYKCAGCGEIFEVLRGMNEKISPPCPKCQGVALQIFYAPHAISAGNSSSEGHAGGACSSCASGACSSCGGH